MRPHHPSREAILTLYAQGVAPSAIATQVGLEPHTVRDLIGYARRSNDERTRNRLRPEAFKWTDELLATAVRLKDEGRSAREIGDEIGASKNTIIGKLYRLGQPIGRKPAAPPKPRAPSPSIRPSRAKSAGKPVEPVVALPAPVAAPKSVLRLVSVGKPIWNLSVDECRWPVSPDEAETHLFCASPITTAGPYCDDCRKLAYAPAGFKPRIGHTAGRRFG